MNVLSLFDGISCGQLALQRAGIKYNKYFASEIDKYPKAVTQYHFPETIQLGNIKKWHEWKLPHIDMIIGGSPCQGFSCAGKGLNFEDPRSTLFFDFLDIVNHYKPQYFLLENVKMKKEWQNIITEYMQVEPVLINSALVSAQNRERLYWTNIPDIMQPKDKGLLLRDILEQNASNKYNKSKTAMQFVIRNNVKLRYPRKKAYTITSKYFRDNKQGRKNDVISQKEIRCFLEKHIDQISWGNYKSGISKSRIIENAKELNNKASCITTECNNPTGAGQNVLFYQDFSWRKLTPIECERLQTIPDNYTLVPHPHFKGGRMMSDSRRYSMVGNAWTVDVVAHIFSFIKNDRG